MEKQQSSDIIPPIVFLDHRRGGDMTVMKPRHLITLWVVLQITAAPLCSANQYNGFSRLTPTECIPANETILSRIPPVWRKYGEFVKICNFRKGSENSRISIISVWEQEYFSAVTKAGKPPALEPFPLPVIVNDKLSEVGTLPEVYPVDDVTSTIVHYGRWQNRIPTVILVDVKNPAEGGDYYYAPMVYNTARGKYEMRDKEIINGRRR